MELFSIQLFNWDSFEEYMDMDITLVLTEKENLWLKECIKQLTTEIEELRDEKHSSQNFQGRNIENESVKSKNERCNGTYKTKRCNIVFINMLWGQSISEEEGNAIHINKHYLYII